jgi:methylmalonyl-CoA/ethylmalonyl-CoA epimerase
MTIQKISHIGIAVKDLERQVHLYRDLLGLELINEEVVEDQKVRVAMLRIGESTIELLSPTSPESPVAKFLEKRGEGIHHVAYEVSDLPGQLAHLTAEGVDLIDKSPRDGAHGKRIAFLHPRSTFGVLTELCEQSR